jgi:hypothetical protein
MKPSQNLCPLSLWGLSLATSPVILIIPVLQIVGEVTTEVGKMSEELFRSHRLPLLYFPEFDRESSLLRREREHN